MASTGKTKKKPQRSQRTAQQRSREQDDARKQNLADGSLTCRDDLNDADDDSDFEGIMSNGRGGGPEHQVVMYIGCMLSSGRALARANPDDPELSSDETVSKIQVGDAARICDGVERFWTRVYAVDDELLMAQVGSKLASGRWGLGERICFLRKHVYAVESFGA